MNKLDKQLQQISDKIEAHDAVDERVSQASVGWHIEHMLLSINGIIMALQRSDPSEYRRSFNLKRLVIFTLRWIPRGSARSPRSVVPKTFSDTSLISHLDNTKQNVKLLDHLPKGSFFVHPYFGSLDLKNTRVFIDIHTDHHLKMINDILKQRARL